MDKGSGWDAWMRACVILRIFNTIAYGFEALRVQVVECMRRRVGQFGRWSISVVRVSSSHFDGFHWVRRVGRGTYSPH